jgi:subtilase-type serine protease
MRRILIFLITSALALSGCSGGGSDSPQHMFSGDESTTATYPLLNPSAAASYQNMAEFKAVSFTASEENALRSQLGLAPLCSGSTNPDCTGASTYGLQNIHYAHTAIADGKEVKGDGQLIAIVDDGFRVSHREFQGKHISTYLGATSELHVDDHGTSVAGIAAARIDDRGMMGVAPNARLHLTSWGNVTSSFLSHLTGATLDARQKGAVVQNNSWGWTNEKAASEELADFKASGQASYADYLPSRLGGTATQWGNLFSAYRNFQQSGVVVFANSNDRTLPDADAWSALPLFVPELKGAWIVASNALFEVDGSNGQILKADLISAPCGSAASFCLTASGSVYAPTASSNTSYALMTGTSFVAPQISGQIALLAQAFPNLSPQELSTRLFATARSDWSGFQQSVSGNVNLAPGVSKPVSNLYGYGVPDMAAALSPVGGLSIASGDNVVTSPRHGVGDGVEASGPIIGASLRNAIAGRRVMVLDQLGSDFYLSGEELVKSAHVDNDLPNPADALAGNLETLSFSFRQADQRAHTLEDTAVAKLFFSQANQVAGEPASFSRLIALRENEYLHFSGQFQENVKGGGLSFAVSRLMKRGPFGLEMSLSGGHTANSFFGAVSDSPFLSTRHSSNFATSFSLSAPLNNQWSFTSFAELGAGTVSMNDNSLVTYSPLAHASLGVSATGRQLVTERDQLTIYGGIRPTAIAGSGSIRLPVSRDQSGNISFERHRFGVASTDLPFRVGLSYATPLVADFDLRLGLNSDFQKGMGHSASFAVGLKKTF